MASFTQAIPIPRSTANTDTDLASSLASSPGELSKSQQNVVFIPSGTSESRAGYAALSQEDSARRDGSPTASQALYFKFNPETQMHQLVKIGNQRVEDLTRDKTPKKCCSPRRKCCYAITAFVLACITTLGIVIWYKNKDN